MRSHYALLYAVAGQTGRSVCVLSAARDTVWIGIVFVAVLFALHLQQAYQLQRELRLVVWVVVLVTPWETLLIRAGLIAYPYDTLWAGFAPPWLLAPWVLFTIQVNVLFRWLRDRWWLALALEAVTGPLSFRAGATLGAVYISAMAATLGTLAIGWTIWMPLLIRTGERSDGTGIPP